MIRHILKPQSVTRTISRSFAEGSLVKTAFYDMHKELGGKMVPFAGYELPVQYTGLGVMAEHNWTRDQGKASLFDVSHMGQIYWHGKDRYNFVEKVIVGDLQVLKPGEGKLSLIMNEAGGIMDDTVITNAGDSLYMVVNGACKHKDMAHFNRYMDELKMDVTMEYLEDQQLLALQGDGAKAVMSRLCPSVDFVKMGFMEGGQDTEVAGIPVRITRCGYTGEDGFEISVSFDHGPKLMATLLEQPEVQPCGLGARDSLRLEAGLCLYGNDLDETINPVEGGLVWTIGGPKSRRRTEQGFLGAETFLTPEGKLKKQSQKRVGITGMKAPARAGTEIFSADGSKKIGTVTSGGFGPTFKGAVAMGYVETDMSKDETPIALNIRNKMVPAAITKMPFVETHYYRAP